MQVTILNMKRDTRQGITQPQRNKCRKCILDAYNDQCSLVVETDDLIIDYCRRKEAIKTYASRKERRKTNIAGCGKGI